MSRPGKAKGPLWKLSVAVSPESEDAIGEFLSDHFEAPASIYVNADTNRATADVYLPRKPPKEKLFELTTHLQNLRNAGLGVPSDRIEIVAFKAQDWAESWKRHFKALEVGRRLLIRPSWIKRKLKKKQALVVLDPGLSFGTGQHPTTRFCLEQLVTLRNAGCAQSFLDIGTGSGILAISAAKLGYAPVYGFDFDPEAVRIAVRNALRNRVADKLQIRRQNIASFRTSSTYSVICANLIYDLLLEHRLRIAGSVSDGGSLILAGILRSQFRQVCRGYAEVGLKLSTHHAAGEWQSGRFSAQNKPGDENKNEQHVQNEAKKTLNFRAV
jgi:ribosomal protein L11 methyltransferase